MPYPYKKMTQKILTTSVLITATDRVWVGDEIAKEYYQRRDAGIWSISTGVICGSIK